MNDEERQQYIYDHDEGDYEGSSGEEHEWVDWKRQDDAQRYADIKSEQASWK